MGKLDDQLAALATMSPAQLRGAWLQTFKMPAPAVGHRLLAMALAHRLQGKRLGGFASPPTPLNRRSLRASLGSSRIA